MYLKHILFYSVFMFLCNGIFAQKSDTTHVILNDNNNIYLTVDQRVNDEVELLDKAIGFDSLMKTRVRSNIYTLNQMYFETIRHKNYKMEKMLLIEQVKYINGRRDFLKLFLDKKEYKKYKALEQVAIKADQKRYQENPTDNEEVLKLRSKAQGWDLLNQVIIFSDN